MSETELDNEESKTVVLDLRSWKTVSILITDFPEMGYKSVDEFVNDAVLKLLNYKGIELGKLQTWMKQEGRNWLL